MKRILSVLLSVIILALSLTVGSTAFAAETKVKYDSQKKQFNSQCAMFNYNGDKTVKLIYDKGTNRYKVYYSEKLTKKGKAIFSIKEPTPLAIKGNYVFYSNSATGTIMRRRLDGKGAKKIIKFTKNKYTVRFIICGSRLIYNLIVYDGNGDFVSSKLYSATTKGENRKLIAKNVKSQMFMYKNMLYFIKGKDLMRYSFNDGVLKSRYVGLNLKDAELIGMENNIVYIAYYKGEMFNKCNFYKADVDKQKYWKFESIECDEPIQSAIVFENKPYIITGLGGGCEFAAVRGEKSDYKSYKNKYNQGGDSLGFWKNSIVFDDYKDDAKYGDFCFNKYVVMAQF